MQTEKIKQIKQEVLEEISKILWDKEFPQPWEDFEELAIMFPEILDIPIHKTVKAIFDEIEERVNKILRVLGKDEPCRDESELEWAHREGEITAWETIKDMIKELKQKWLGEAAEDESERNN